MFSFSPIHERATIDTPDQADAVPIFLFHHTDIQTGHGINGVKTVDPARSEKHFHNRHNVPI
jgi:hypothetical protein